MLFCNQCPRPQIRCSRQHSPGRQGYFDCFLPLSAHPGPSAADGFEPKSRRRHILRALQLSRHASGAKSQQLKTKEGKPTAEFSWFPGFAWAMAHCRSLTPWSRRGSLNLPSKAAIATAIWAGPSTRKPLRRGERSAGGGGGGGQCHGLMVFNGGAQGQGPLRAFRAKRGGSSSSAPRLFKRGLVLRKPHRGVLCEIGLSWLSSGSCSRLLAREAVPGNPSPT